MDKYLQNAEQRKRDCETERILCRGNCGTMFENERANLIENGKQRDALGRAFNTIGRMSDVCLSCGPFHYQIRSGQLLEKKEKV